MSFTNYSSCRATAFIFLAAACIAPVANAGRFFGRFRCNVIQPPHTTCSSTFETSCCASQYCCGPAPFAWSGNFRCYPQAGPYYNFIYPHYLAPQQISPSFITPNSDDAVTDPQKPKAAAISKPAAGGGGAGDGKPGGGGGGAGAGGSGAGDGGAGAGAGGSGAGDGKPAAGGGGAGAGAGASGAGASGAGSVKPATAGAGEGRVNGKPAGDTNPKQGPIVDDLFDPQNPQPREKQPLPKDDTIESAEPPSNGKTLDDLFGLIAPARSDSGKPQIDTAASKRLVSFGNTHVSTGNDSQTHQETDFARTHMRMWTDDTGKYRINARLIEVNVVNSVATLLKASGTTCEVTFSRLSDTDRNYIKQQIDSKRAPWRFATQQ